MCDYSLGGLPNRLAVDGEELIVHRFSTHSIGLASPADLQTKTREERQRDQSLWHRIKSSFTPASDCLPVRAVCVPPGARLVLKSIPMDLRCKWSVGADESVFFMQTSTEVNTYRDALHFRTGRQVLLQDLASRTEVKCIAIGIHLGTGLHEEYAFVRADTPFASEIHRDTLQHQTSTRRNADCSHRVAIERRSEQTLDLMPETLVPLPYLAYLALQICRRSQADRMCREPMDN